MAYGVSFVFILEITSRSFGRIQWEDLINNNYECIRNGI